MKEVKTIFKRLFDFKKDDKTRVSIVNSKTKEEILCFNKNYLIVSYSIVSTHHPETGHHLAILVKESGSSNYRVKIGKTLYPLVGVIEKY